MTATPPTTYDTRVSADEVARWRREQRQRYGDDDSGRLRPRRRARPAPDLEKVAVTFAIRGLRPIVDAALAIVLCDCPDCRGQEADPLGLYRPLQVIPRDGRVAALCTACGVREVLDV